MADPRPWLLACDEPEVAGLGPLLCDNHVIDVTALGGSKGGAGTALPPAASR